MLLYLCWNFLLEIASYSEKGPKFGIYMPFLKLKEGDDFLSFFTKIIACFKELHAVEN